MPRFFNLIYKIEDKYLCTAENFLVDDNFKNTFFK